MKLIKWILLALLLVGCEGDRYTTIINSPPKKPHPEHPRHTPKQIDNYIVVLKHGSASAFGIVPKHEYKNVFSGFSAECDKDTYEMLVDHPSVLVITPDVEMFTCEQAIPTGVDIIEADQNPISKIDGVDERVDIDIAIFDTGIDRHPDLNVYRRFDFSGEGIYDRNRHGTHVAGTIGALDNDKGVVGVAPGARLWSFKVFNRGGSGYISTIVTALDYAMQFTNEIEVINMSLGGFGYNEPLHLAIQAVVDKGVVVCVAAGNNGMDIYGPDGIPLTWDDFTPANFPEVITVSAMFDTDGKMGGLDSTILTNSGDDFLATFSNYGEAVDVAMPGVFILSTVLHRKYGELSGTSMATPHAAGLAGLLIAKYGKPVDASGVAHIKQLMQDNAVAQSAWRLDGFMNDFDIYHEGLGQCN